MNEKRFRIVKLGKCEEEYFVDCEQEIIDYDDYLEVGTFSTMSNQQVVDLLNELVAKCHSLEKENEQLKSLVNACEYGQKSLMEEMKNNDEALDKIWEIMKDLYGVIDDE